VAAGTRSDGDRSDRAADRKFDETEVVDITFAKSQERNDSIFGDGPKSAIVRGRDAGAAERCRECHAATRIRERSADCLEDWPGGNHARRHTAGARALGGAVDLTYTHSVR